MILSRKCLIFALLCLFSQKSHAFPSNSLFTAGCKIFDVDGKIVRKFPGLICIFLPSGELITSDGDSSIALFSSDMSLSWNIAIHGHHQLNLSNDKNHILVLSSDIKRFKNENIRSDSLLVLDFKGNIISQFHLVDSQDWSKNGPKNTSNVNWWGSAFSNISRESTHVNSFFQIPKNSSSLKAFSEGNYIANDIINADIFVLDRDLKKIIWKFNYSDLQYVRIHNVQVLQNGHLLIYNNALGSTSHSSIDEVDPVAKKIVWRYISNPPELFASEKLGSIQALENGHIFFSDITNGEKIFEITRDKKIVSQIKLENSKIKNSQIRMANEDLVLFLNKNHAL